MGFLTKLAFKNLFRHKLRTLVSIIAIAFTVMIVVFARGYILGAIDSTYANQIYYNSGHIKIVDQEYWEQERIMPLIYPVDGFPGGDLEEMVASLQETDEIEMVIPRLKFGAMVSTEEDLVAMSGWGVDPEQEILFTNIGDFLVEGRMVEPGKLEVVMGTALLEKLDRRVGETVTILMNTAFSSLRGVTFKIVGRLETGLKVLNEHLFYLPLDQAQRILEMEGQVTEVLLVTSKRNLVKKVLPKVKELIAERGADGRYLALSFKEASDIMAFLEMANIIYNEVYVFLVLLGCIVMIMTMIMIVKERTKEIGTMMALGLESKNILQLFLIEGAIMGSIGSFLGALSGLLFTGYLAKHGIDFGEAVGAFDAAHLINPIIYPVSSPGNAIFAFVLGSIIVTIACLIPARRAARLEPTEAMREE